VTKEQIYQAFISWWKEKGYKYIPENEEEGDWCNVVKYWAWKAFKEAMTNAKK